MHFRADFATEEGTLKDFKKLIYSFSYCLILLEAIESQI